LSVPDEGYSRNVSCTLNLISLFLLIYSWLSLSRIRWDHGKTRVNWVIHNSEEEYLNTINLLFLYINVYLSVLLNRPCPFLLIHKHINYGICHYYIYVYCIGLNVVYILYKWKCLIYLHFTKIHNNNPKGTVFNICVQLKMKTLLQNYPHTIECRIQIAKFTSDKYNHVYSI
jgi:hypothetical protein